jgi:hypothetical protein
MSEIKNPLELYKFLPKTNCGQCGVPSCMAFSARILQGLLSISACPHLDKEAVELISWRIVRRKNPDDEYDVVIKQLQNEVQHLDFSRVAPRIGATVKGDQLAINCLGKDFFISPAGEMTSTCHINHWLHVPMLHYIIECEGLTPANDWIPFHELSNAGQWSQYFSHRCEEALRLLADAHRELIFEILSLFGARAITTTGDADYSLVIMPLPKVPFLIHYWQEEDGFPSQLNILLDRSANRNINAHSINLLARGIVEMFRQLVVSHGKDGKLY